MKIVEYTNNENIVVEFQDDHKFRKKAMYTNFRTGSVTKIKLRKTIRTLQHGTSGTLTHKTVAKSMRGLQ